LLIDLLKKLNVKYTNVLNYLLILNLLRLIQIIMELS